ncbi:MAG: hypothetical protein ABF736_05845 [Liquorilactobacillus satsumensis]|uniref:hypothetical protein n=1 Tax=Liquorilactobacillus satsumensis TaxID=259059 RepID=UPI0039EAA918
MLIILLAEIAMFIFGVLGIVQAIKLNKTNKEIRVFRIKERAKLTEDQIKKQQVYLKILMSKFIVFIINPASIVSIILLVLFGYSLRNLFDKSGSLVFFLISLLMLTVILYASFVQKSVTRGQAIKKKYIAKYPDNPLKFFIYPDELLIQYRYVFKRACILLLITSILAFIMGLIS